MKDILTAPFMIEMIRTTTNMYNQGWDERNGGNISLLLSEEEVSQYGDVKRVLRTIPTGFNAPELDGKYFLVTGTGKYFRYDRDQGGPSGYPPPANPAAEPDAHQSGDGNAAGQGIGQHAAAN